MDNIASFSEFQNKAAIISVKAHTAVQPTSLEEKSVSVHQLKGCLANTRRENTLS